MKKRVFFVPFLIVFLLATTLLSGCSSTSSQTSDGAANGKVVKLEFWDMVWGPPEYIDTAKKLVDKFNSEHKNIQVEYKSVPWNNWYQTYATAVASGTAPDISTGASYQPLQFYDQGAIQPLDNVVKDFKSNGLAKDFYPGTLEALNYKGHYVGIPWQIDISVPWYRKDIFDQAGVKVPTNWSQFITTSKSLTKNGKYGLAVGGAGSGYKWLFSSLLNNGGGFFGKDKSVDVKNQTNLETIRYMSTLEKNGSINPASVGYQDADMEKSFAQGNSAIIYTSPGEDKKLGLEGKAMVMPPLKSSTGKEGTVEWVNSLMMYKQSKHPEEVKTFIEWWLNNDKPLWTDGHMTSLPVRKSFAQDPIFQNDPNMKMILNQWVPIAKTISANYNHLFPELNKLEGSTELITAVQHLIQGQDPNKVLNDLNNVVNGAMGK